MIKTRPYLLQAIDEDRKTHEIFVNDRLFWPGQHLELVDEFNQGSIITVEVIETSVHATVADIFDLHQDLLLPGESKESTVAYYGNIYSDPQVANPLTPAEKGIGVVLIKFRVVDKSKYYDISKRTMSKKIYMICIGVSLCTAIISFIVAISVTVYWAVRGAPGALNQEKVKTLIIPFFVFGGLFILATLVGIIRMCTAYPTHCFKVNTEV